MDRTDFTECAARTVREAGRLYGAGGKEERAVAEAWKAVGVKVKADAAARVMR